VKTYLAIVAAAVLSALAWGFVVGNQPVPSRAYAQGPEVGAAWYEALPTDPAAATAAYLDRVPAEARARGDAFENTRYIALPLGIITLLGTTALLMFSGAATAMRSLARRISPSLPLQDAMLAVPVLATYFLLGLPASTYAGFVRVRQAGFSHAPYLQWLRDASLQWAVITVFYIVGVVAIYWLIRRRPRSWPGWATAVYAVLSAAFVLVSPLYIDPLFNKFTPMADGPQKQAILSLARANGVPAADVFVQDASRQGVLLNAHVSGFGGTARIVLDDNTIAATPHPEVAMVMAHEIGHYVLSHVVKGIIFDTLVTGIGFLFVGWGLLRLIGKFGSRWDVRDAADIGGLPLFWCLLMLWGILSLPVSNSITRAQEKEADLYGLNASRQPLAVAEFMIRDADARRLDPSWIEETVFYTHPSGRNRVFTAMRWRAEHLLDEAGR
jgi:STE24 endopeptidase